jgi:hypothetical protein
MRTRELQQLDVFLNRTRTHTFNILNSVLWLRGSKSAIVRAPASLRPRAALGVARRGVGALPPAT